MLGNEFGYTGTLQQQHCRRMLKDVGEWILHPVSGHAGGSKSQFWCPKCQQLHADPKITMQRGCVFNFKDFNDFNDLVFVEKTWFNKALTNIQREVFYYIDHLPSFKFTLKHIPCSTHSKEADRIAFADATSRKYINEFVKTKGKVTDLLANRLRDLSIVGPVFDWLITHFQLTTNPVSTVPRGIINFFQCLGSKSPVCSYLFPSEENIGLVKSLTEDRITPDFPALRTLQCELPIFHGLVTSIKGVSVLPRCFQILLNHLGLCAEAPFNPEYKIPDSPVGKPSKLS